MSARNGCYLIAWLFVGLGFYFAFTVPDIGSPIVCWACALFSFFLGEITDDGELS